MRIHGDDLIADSPKDLKDYEIDDYEPWNRDNVKLSCVSILDRKRKTIFCSIDILKQIDFNFHE